MRRSLHQLLTLTRMTIAAVWRHVRVPRSRPWSWRAVHPSAPLVWLSGGMLVFLALLYGVSALTLHGLATAYTPVKPVLLRPFADYGPWSRESSFALSEAAIRDSAADRRRADDADRSLWQRVHGIQPRHAPSATPDQPLVGGYPGATASPVRATATALAGPTEESPWPVIEGVTSPPSSPPTRTLPVDTPTTGAVAGGVPAPQPPARVPATATLRGPQVTTTAVPGTTHVLTGGALGTPTPGGFVPPSSTANPPLLTATSVGGEPVQPSSMPQPAPSAPPNQPTATALLTARPTATRTAVPPTALPTARPTATRTAVPPTALPTATATPTAVPPTALPTDLPTATPTDLPMATPTDLPTATPTDLPMATPTDLPTATPTVMRSPGLLAEYYERGLTTPVLTRRDPTIDFDWDYGSPDPALPTDYFSARWVGFIEPRFSERYSITLSYNASARLWINDQLIINDWDSYRGNAVASVMLQQNQRVAIVIEYYEDGDLAWLNLGWQSASQPWEIIPQSRLYPPNAPAAGPDAGTGLDGTYYRDSADRADYFGHVVASGVVPTLDLAWSDSEFPGLQDDLWAGRWSGVLIPRYTETYDLITRSDDGVRIWVDGQLLIDNWTNHGVTEDRGTVTLVANQPYTLRVELYDYINEAVIQLSWESPSQVREVVPADRLFHDIP